MIEYGRHHFQKARPAPGGGSIADHMAVVNRKRKGAPAPAGPQLPDEVVHLWNTFVRLSAARSSAGFGGNPISYAEIEAYTRLSRLPLEAWEVDAIRELDDLFLEEASKGPAKH